MLMYNRTTIEPSDRMCHTSYTIFCAMCDVNYAIAGYGSFSAIMFRMIGIGDLASDMNASKLNADYPRKEND